MVHLKSGISILLVDDDKDANLHRRRLIMAKLGDEINNCFIATTKQDVIKHLKTSSPTLILSTNAVLDKTETHSVPIDVPQLIESCRPDSDTTHAFMGTVLIPLYFSIGKNRLKKRLYRVRSAAKRKAKRRLSKISHRANETAMS